MGVWVGGALAILPGLVGGLGDSYTYFRTFKDQTIIYILYDIPIP